MYQRGSRSPPGRSAPKYAARPRVSRRMGFTQRFRPGGRIVRRFLAECLRGGLKQMGRRGGMCEAGGDGHLDSGTTKAPPPAGDEASTSRRLSGLRGRVVVVPVVVVVGRVVVVTARGGAAGEDQRGRGEHHGEENHEHALHFGSFRERPGRSLAPENGAVNSLHSRDEEPGAHPSAFSARGFTSDTAERKGMAPRICFSHIVRGAVAPPPVGTGPA